MGRTQFGVAVALLAVLVGVTAFGIFKPAGTHPKLEYKVAAVPDVEFDTAMATIGGDGWGLVFAPRATGAREEKRHECIFKRPQ